MPQVTVNGAPTFKFMAYIAGQYTLPTVVTLRPKASARRTNTAYSDGGGLSFDFGGGFVASAPSKQADDVRYRGLNIRRALARAGVTPLSTRVMTARRLNDANPKQITTPVTNSHVINRRKMQNFSESIGV